MPDEGLVVSGTIDALHDEVERLQARVRELEADPRMALSKDDLILAQQFAEARAQEHRRGTVPYDLWVLRAKRFAAAAGSAPYEPPYLAAVSAGTNTPRSRGFADNIINWKAKEGDSE